MKSTTSKQSLCTYKESLVHFSTVLKFLQDDNDGEEVLGTTETDEATATLC